MELKDLFTKYEPPPGGLEKLRARLVQEERKSLPWRFLRPAFWIYAGAAAVVVCLAVLFIVQIVLSGLPLAEDPFSRLVAQSDDPSLIRYGLVKALDEAVTVPEKNRGDFAVLRVPVKSEDVIFYWISARSQNEEQEKKEEQL